MICEKNCRGLVSFPQAKIGFGDQTPTRKSDNLFIPFLHEVALNIKMTIVSLIRSEEQLLSALLQRNGISSIAIAFY